MTGPLRAETLPLPTRLGNISVSLNRTEFLFPLFSVQPLGNLTAITLQVPHNLSFRFEDVRQRILVVHEGDKSSDPVFLQTMTNSIHVIRTCDSIFIPQAASCQPVVTHADGRLVTQFSPASPGEVLVAYALGLGDTVPSAVTGAAAQAAQLRTPVELHFDFTPNAPATDTRRLTGTTISPLYAGLVAGAVGLYQINFRVPDVPRQLTRCGGSVLSNLTVSMGQSPTPNALGDPGSFTGVGICVQPAEQLNDEMSGDSRKGDGERLYFKKDSFPQLRIEKQSSKKKLE